MITHRMTYLNGVMHEVITVVLPCGHVRHGVITYHGSVAQVMRIWKERI